MYNPFALTDKSILVTGASSGIGQAVAIECSMLGAKLIITGRNTERLNDTFSKLDGDNHLQIRADLTEQTDIEFLIKSIKELNGVCHCAGITNPIPFNFINRQQLDDIFDLNFFAPIIITKELVKLKILKKSSSIVFISSISGVYVSYIAQTLYSSSKGALNGAIKGMALDLAPKGIRVNSVCPGMINTSILSDGRIDEEQMKENEKRYPLQRFGDPKEVAYAVIYLLSDVSKWVTGTNLLIDGGYTLL